MTETNKITYEEMVKNPILKPLMEYKNAYSLFEEEDKRESENLKTFIAELNSLMELVDMKDSLIGSRYSTVCETYKRILWTYTKTIRILDEKFNEAVSLINSEYVLRKMYEKELEEHERELDYLKSKLKEEKIVEPVVEKTEDEIEKLRKIVEKTEEKREERKTAPSEEEENEELRRELFK